MTGTAQDVSFPGEGVTCAATLYLPAPGGPPTPGLVMGNGFANVRQMYLPRYARALAAAGFAVLAIDYRCFGESGGQPPQLVSPDSQCDDMRNALSWLSEQPQVDPDRQGLWGVSIAGGNVLRIAAYDRRVRSVVTQAPAIGL